MSDRVADWRCDACGAMHGVELPEDVDVPERPTGWAPFRLGELDGDVCPSCLVTIESTVRVLRRRDKAHRATNGAT